MYEKILLLICFILFIVLIIHIVIFIISEDDGINLNRNRGIHKLKILNCSPNTIIKKIELIGTGTRYSGNLVSEFLSHYDFLFTDAKENKYLGFVKNKGDSREFIIMPIKLKRDWIDFKFHNSIYKRLNQGEFSINSTIKNITDTFKKINHGYHIFYHNCQHKTKQLVNILVGKNVYDLKKYTVGYCFSNLFKDIIKAII